MGKMKFKPKQNIPSFTPKRAAYVIKNKKLKIALIISIIANIFFAFEICLRKLLSN